MAITDVIYKILLISVIALKEQVFEKNGATVQYDSHHSVVYVIIGEILRQYTLPDSKMIDIFGGEEPDAKRSF